MATQYPNIMDIFRGAPVNPQQTANPVPGTQNTGPNGVVPPVDGPQNNQNQNNQNQNNQNNPPQKKEEKPTPLADFATLWDPAKAGEVDPNAGLDFAAVDPKKMMEAAQKVDFSQILTPEIQTEIAKGGAEGVNATIQAMNKMSQLVYGQSAMATTKIVAAAVEQARNQFAQQIPGLVKSAAMQNALVKSNPIFQNPAMTPIVDGLKSQLLAKFPTATQDQLTEMAQKYFVEVASSFGAIPNTNTQNPDANKKKIKNMTGKGEENWADFFDLENPSN